MERIITMNNKSTIDIKQLYRTIYLLVKQLDERKFTIRTITDIFSTDIDQLRNEIIAQSELLIFTSHDNIGKKAREIFWRKGYYDLISLAKRIWSKADARPENEMAELILDGIEKFKSIVIKLEKEYELNLQYIIDFSLLDTMSTLNDKKMIEKTVNAYNENDSDVGSLKFSWETINYGLETIHAFLLSIGDLHRYYIDFKFTPSTITRDYAAKFYYEAFKLNPKVGMAQNQLGTLYSGLHHDLYSLYYYLYSLVCEEPFELSENNAMQIFQKNSEYLESMENEKLQNNLRDFTAQFILIIDIFFYDKEITDFNMLCHCMLVSMRDILKSTRITVPHEFWYKIVSTLFFCMAKLNATDSSKKYSLNAFLVAICSELVNACLNNLETFLDERSSQNTDFQHYYTKLFDKFDDEVRRSRECHRTLQNKSNINNNNKNNNNDIEEKKEQISQISDISYEKSVTTSESQNSTNNDVDKENIASCSAIISKPNNDTIPSVNDNVNMKKVTNKLRRRRKKISSYEDDMNSDLSSNFESDIEMDSDFSSGDDEDEEDSYASSYISSNDDYGEDENIDDDDDTFKYVKETAQYGVEQLNGKEYKTIFSDNDDIVIEEEQIIYSNDINKSKTVPDNPELSTYYLDPTAELIKNLTNIELTSLDFCFTDDDDKDLIIEEETIVYTQRNDVASSNSSPNTESSHNRFDKLELNMESNCTENDLKFKTIDDDKNVDKSVKLRYKRKYSKIDPNLIIDFAKKENSLMALKILFDWLKINNEILVNCFSTNPEFIHKIMKLLNQFNIDIFTNKVYFERYLLRTENVRDNLRSLFDIINAIPMQEDTYLKKFSVLESVQQNLDWEVCLRTGITENEENILRIFKLVDFGFFMCKMKKFKYNFCAKSRRFIEISNKKDRDKGKRRENHKRNDKRNYGKQNKELNENRTRERRDQNSNSTNVDDLKNVLPKKSYLKNRNHQSEPKQATEKENFLTENKYEIMGKLWLRNEVKTLESKIIKPDLMTPFLVMDSKSLTQYTSIVKNLMKTKKFIILIPSAVFSELDELKKTSDRARNAIRWLEKEFRKGSRFLRPQRKHESLNIPLLKIPKKLDREASIFLKIAEFCNFIQKHHSNENDPTSGGGTEATAGVLTLLTGDHLNGKKSLGFSYTGILNAMSVDFEQIVSFYGNYKKK